MIQATHIPIPHLQVEAKREVVNELNEARASFALVQLYGHMEHKYILKLCKKFEETKRRLMLNGAENWGFASVEISR